MNSYDLFLVAAKKFYRGSTVELSEGLLDVDKCDSLHIIVTVIVDGQPKCGAVYGEPLRSLTGWLERDVAAGKYMEKGVLCGVVR